MPVYNEQDCIADVIGKWRKELDKLRDTCIYTLHIYNDGSKDATWQILEKLSPENLVIHNKPNSGHGPTILQAYKELCTQADWIFQTDSDDELSPEYFPLLWEKRKDYDLLCGNRGSYNQALPRKIISMISRLCVKCFYGSKVSDVNNPYRLMRASLFTPLFRKIPDKSFAPNVILSGLVALQKDQIRLYEIPVTPISRRTGVVSIRKWKLLLAAATSFFQTFSVALHESPRAIFLFLFLLVLSFILKFLSAQLGANFDFDSYCIVKDIVKNGGNVYAETTRYNYGPVWFYTLHFLDLIPFLSFRCALVGFLSLCDGIMAAILWKAKLKLPALLFLLSPIAIYISGMHNQFDNFAVLFALCASLLLSSQKQWSEEITSFRASNTVIYPEKTQDPSTAKVLTGAFLLGLSLCIKHIFIFLPFWFFFSLKGNRAKCIILFLPLTIFAGAFLPYIHHELFTEAFFHTLFQAAKEFFSGDTQSAFFNFFDSLQKNFPTMHNMWKNVFAYQSYDNQIFYNYFLPGIFSIAFIPKIIFLSGMIFSGFFFRKRTPFFQFLAYTGLLLILTTATTNQYLAIPQLFTSIFYFPFGIFYNISGFLFYIDPEATYNRLFYFLAPAFLLSAFIWFYRRNLAKVFRYIAEKLEK